MNLLRRIQYAKDTNIDEAAANVEAGVKQFVKFVQGLIDKNFKEKYKNLEPTELIYKKGKKYFKIIRLDMGTKEKPAPKGKGYSQSVHSFVNAETGDIMKAASWAAPTTKNPRGNVLDKNTWKNAVDKVGYISYLR